MSTPERAPLDARGWWLLQARGWIKQARMWRERFGGDDHDACLGWYIHALLKADQYRRWVHELAPAFVDVDELLEVAS